MPPTHPSAFATVVVYFTLVITCTALTLATARWLKLHGHTLSVLARKVFPCCR